jgi:carbon storage regulator
MLVLSRKANESIVIDGRIIVKIVRLEGEVVKLGIEAPPDVPVHRQEVYEEIQRSNREALIKKRSVVPKLPVSASPVVKGAVTGVPKLPAKTNPNPKNP